MAFVFVEDGFGILIACSLGCIRRGSGPITFPMFLAESITFSLNPRFSLSRQAASSQDTQKAHMTAAGRW